MISKTRYNLLISKVQSPMFIIISSYTIILTIAWLFFVCHRWSSGTSTVVVTADTSAGGGGGGRSKAPMNFLRLRSVQRTDAGNYTCTARNTVGSKSLQHQVIVTPDMSAHVVPALADIESGRSVSLTCITSAADDNVSFFLKIFWSVCAVALLFWVLVFSSGHALRELCRVIHPCNNTHYAVVVTEDWVTVWKQ